MQIRCVKTEKGKRERERKRYTNIMYGVYLKFLEYKRLNIYKKKH